MVTSDTLATAYCYSAPTTRTHLGTSVAAVVGQFGAGVARLQAGEVFLRQLRQLVVGHAARPGQHHARRRVVRRDVVHQVLAGDAPGGSAAQSDFVAEHVFQPLYCTFFTF